MPNHHSGCISSSPDPEGAAATQDFMKELGNSGIQTHARIPSRVHVAPQHTQS